MSFYLFNLLTQTIKCTVSINSLGNISNLMTNNQFQAVFVHSCQLCPCYKGMTGFVRVVIHTLCNVLEYLLTYFVRITACEINKNLSKFMKSMYDRVIYGNYDNYYEDFVVFLNTLKANDRMPTDEEFEDALIHKPLYKKSISSHCK